MRARVAGRRSRVDDGHHMESDQQAQRQSPIAVIGFLAALLGLFGAFYFFAIFDASVPTDDGKRIYNVGLLADRQNGLMFCGVVAILGAIGFAATRKPGVPVRLRPSRRFMWIAAAVAAGLLIVAAATGFLTDLWVSLILRFG